MIRTHVQSMRFAARLLLNRARELSTYAYAYGARSRDEQQGFLILSGGRRGSHLLIDLLNNHPDVHCDGEIFGRRSACRLVSPELFIRGLSKQHRERQYGFKTSIGHLKNFQQLNTQEFLQTMHDRGWGLIHLVRQNVLRVCMSSMLAHRRRQWHATNDNPVTPVKLTIDCHELYRQLVRRSETLATEIKYLSELPHLRVVYEQNLLDATQHQFTLDRVFKFLDIPSAVVSASLMRTSPNKFAEFVDNIDEIHRYLSGTPFARFLDK